MTTPKIIFDKYGSQDAPETAKFGRGASTAADIKRALDARDRLRREQNENAATGKPVRRDQ